MNKSYFLNKLHSKKLDFLKKNKYDILPETFSAFDKVPITCSKHGIFYQRAYSHLNGSDCSECGKIKCAENRALTTANFVNKSTIKFGNRFGYEKTYYKRKNIDLVITCPLHGDIVITPDIHFRSTHGCPKCDFELPREVRKNAALEKAAKIHNFKYDYSKVKYETVTEAVEIICPKHGSFWQSLSYHIGSKSNCPKCARLNNTCSQEQFIIKAKAIHGDNYDYSKVKYETNRSMVTITCKKHGDFIQRAGSHLAGNKCLKCFFEYQIKTTEKFIEDARHIHGDNYDYSKVKYRGNKKHVEIICPKHGSFWQKPNSHLSTKNGCRFCMESKGERAVEQCLKKYNIEYIREFRLVPHRLRSDFFLPGLNIHIEFNGLQHYKPIDMFGGPEGFKKVKENDLIKKQLIRERGDSLIVLTYLHLKDDSVEKELILRLKQIYRYWFVVNGKNLIFKNVLDVSREFKLSKTTLVTAVEKELEKTINGFQVLF